MIQINETKIEFNYMGLFTTSETWIHPKACEKTCEIIYVTKGTVFLEEEGEKYELREGELIFLAPGKVHEGFCESHGRTSFYWVHFNIEGYSPNTFTLNNFTYVSLFKELLHYSSTPVCPKHSKDCVLAHLLSEISSAREKADASTLAANAVEWARINASCGLSVARVAEHFGYNSEHISRLVKKQYGLSLKSIIDDFLIKKAQSYLCNTTYSIKEISNMLGFSSPNAFIHFYKYHEKKSPTDYRNSFTNIHMNKS